ncbi:hypothetical protein [Streptomyces sp. CL12-4]|uniref:hypothetical protein n=1 Tax=Streptomyces sp. CL12-4 TaxID=2810306 RepID=UPI001EFA5C11|nr:hypothetical protein [Streptomyces sp. CL12-4]MCG8971823.1 hypothetical protein [Streptomyces sp. CL12-4]
MTTAALPALDALDDEDLNRLFTQAGSILLKRSEAGLPAVILETIREALAEDDDTRKPLRAVFTTSKWDNGYFWYTDGARVTLFDGKTEEIEEIDLSGADDVLSDHVSYLVDPLDSTDRLIVVFEPPTVEVA